MNYWQKQTADKPLFPDIEWSKPERRQYRAKLGLIGGGAQGLMAISDNHTLALKTGIGEIRVLLPDNLKKTLPITIPDVVYAKSNPSGGLSSEAESELNALGEWADGLLMIGDSGKNSQTSILYDNFVANYDKPVTITRNAIDLFKNSFNTLVEKPNILLVMSFAQTQKLFQSVYYPKVLTFNMQLTNMVEALHKFTITYPIKVVTYHQDNLILASDGQIITTTNINPISIWRGTIATKASIYWLWNKSKPLESISASFIEKA